MSVFPLRVCIVWDAPLMYPCAEGIFLSTEGVDTPAQADAVLAAERRWPGFRSASVVSDALVPLWVEAMAGKA